MKKFIKLLKSVLLCTLIVVCICGCGNDTAQYIHSEDSKTTEEKESETTEIETHIQQGEVNVEQKLLYVYVCGSVYHPGVYTLLEGSRICDLFEVAGGLTEEAAKDYWNQAKLLADGEMYYVPTIEEAKELDVSFYSSDVENTDNANGKINLNTASLEQLMEIPGIGESKARAIIDYREKNGGFASVEEVMNIEGIKEGVFSKMKEYIVVN
jgi:competence protein ComEA